VVHNKKKVIIYIINSYELLEKVTCDFSSEHLVSMKLIMLCFPSFNITDKIIAFS